MNIGAKIYYDKLTGNVIVNTGERSGNVVETTTEQDFAVYSELSERVVDTVGMIQLGYGSHSSDFLAGGIITKVDLNTLKPLFTYPETSEEPTEPKPSLSQEVEDIKKRQDLMQQALDDLVFGGAL